MIEARFIDEQGKHLHRCRVAVTRESIEMFAAKWLQPSDQVVMEATTNTWEVAELIRPRVAKVAIANPLKVKVIAEAKTKTDKVDAEVLAQLFRCNFLPEVWIPDQTTRLLCETCAHRAGLIADQTRIKNRIQSLLAQRLIPVTVRVLFNGCGRARNPGPEHTFSGRGLSERKSPSNHPGRYASCRRNANAPTDGNR